MSTWPASSRPDVVALPEIEPDAYRRGVCDFCYRETAVATVATVHQATGCGWSVVACQACITDPGERGRSVTRLRLEDAAQTRMIQEIHDRRAAEVRERARGA